MQDKEYMLTGDEALTVAEQVQILAKASGRDIEVREVATPAEAVRFRYPDGTPVALAGALIEGLALMRADTAGLRTEHGTKAARTQAADFRPAPPSWAVGDAGVPSIT